MTGTCRLMRFSRTTQVPGRHHVKLDNIALLPASLLPFRDELQAIANTLPQGAVLFVVPDEDTPIRESMRRRVVGQLRARGHRVTVVSRGRIPRLQSSIDS